MFYALHRLVKGFFILMALGCLFWLYTQRQALEPIWVWYDVYENGGIQRVEPLPAVAGHGVAVIDGHTFQMKLDNRIVSVRLTGFDQPEAPLSPADIQLEKRRREFLREAVVGKPVKVEVTYSGPDSLLGIVYANDTNLNLYYVSHGMSRFNREYVKTTPRNRQYQFFAADRARVADASGREAQVTRE